MLWYFTILAWPLVRIPRRVLSSLRADQKYTPSQGLLLGHLSSHIDMMVSSPPTSLLNTHPPTSSCIVDLEMVVPFESHGQNLMNLMNHYFNHSESCLGFGKASSILSRLSNSCPVGWSLCVDKDVHLAKCANSYFASFIPNVVQTLIAKLAERNIEFPHSSSKLIEELWYFVNTLVGIIVVRNPVSVGPFQEIFAFSARVSPVYIAELVGIDLGTVDLNESLVFSIYGLQGGALSHEDAFGVVGGMPLESNTFSASVDFSNPTDPIHFCAHLLLLEDKEREQTGIKEVSISGKEASSADHTGSFDFEGSSISGRRLRKRRTSLLSNAGEDELGASGAIFYQSNPYQSSSSSSSSIANLMSGHIINSRNRQRSGMIIQPIDIEILGPSSDHCFIYGSLCAEPLDQIGSTEDTDAQLERCNELERRIIAEQESFFSENARLVDEMVKSRASLLVLLRALSLPDDAILRKINGVEEYEERMRKLGAKLKYTLSPEDLLRTLASIQQQS